MHTTHGEGTACQNVYFAHTATCRFSVHLKPRARSQTGSMHYAWGGTLVAALCLSSHCVLCFSIAPPRPALGGGRSVLSLRSACTGNASETVSSVAFELDPKPKYPYSVVQQGNFLLGVRRAGSMLAVSNDTYILGKEVDGLRERLLRMESLLEEVLFAITMSDDLALLERDAARVLIVGSVVGNERAPRLLRTTLLHIMRKHYIPLPTTAGVVEGRNKSCTL